MERSDGRVRWKSEEEEREQSCISCFCSLSHHHIFLMSACGWLHPCSNFNSKHVNMHTLSLLRLCACVCVCLIYVHAYSAQLIHVFAAAVWCSVGDRVLAKRPRNTCTRAGAHSHAHSHSLPNLNNDPSSESTSSSGATSDLFAVEKKKKEADPKIGC